MPTIHDANRLGLDYRAEAQRLGPPPVPLTDIHTHINGIDAARLYNEVRQLYGIERIYSMSQLENIDRLREIFDEAIHFIAVPNYFNKNLMEAYTTDWLNRIEEYAAIGARICKFWCAPRTLDYEREFGTSDIFALNTEWQKKAMEIAHECGMMFMTHIADPDTWYATKYADSSIYDTKLDQYKPLEEALDQYADTPWIAAHLGGFPEDLAFLDGLLSRHDNLHLDTSATKWMVRELSKYSRADLIGFLRRWSGRIMFGSDIVTTDDHLGDTSTRSSVGERASNSQQAFELYASRYWALRTLYETNYEGESPIADPDLHMVDPERYSVHDAPVLRGKELPSDVIEALYRGTACGLLGI